MILGNLTGISDHNVSLPSSPVRAPAAGVLLRIAPDFSGTEVVADGFRNPYDFAFHELGDVLVFDSDGERDVSLPWYRPTRIFEALPGTHAGWVSPSWKRPDYFPEMPPVSANCGRGSPTGMVFYRHHQFPAPYRGALFALDWTFGRMFSIPLSRDNSHLSGQASEFLSATGEFGFAPTDIAVTPSGDLMISVGGRGTCGGVYRVHYVGNSDSSTGFDTAPQAADKLTECLTAPQPMASWSRARWIPAARQLGVKSLTSASLDAQRPVAQRIRAIEILTELDAGLDPAAARILLDDPSAAVRGRTLWSLGHRHYSADCWQLVKRGLEDLDPVVVRSALNVVRRWIDAPAIDPLLPTLRRLLDAPDRYVWQTAWRVTARLTPGQRESLGENIAEASPRGRSLSHWPSPRLIARRIRRHLRWPGAPCMRHPIHS